MLPIALDDSLPVLVRAGLAPVQFQTIAIEPAGRRAGSALCLHEALKARPILSLPQALKDTGLSFPAASSVMDLLVELGIARELTANAGTGCFAYDRYRAVLSEGTGV